MKLNKNNIGWRTLLSGITFMSFCLIAGASTEALSTIWIVLMVGALMLFAGIGLLEFFKYMTRKRVEKSLWDFHVASCIKMDNDSILYYDDTQEKIRLISIDMMSYEAQEIENVKMSNAMICPPQCDNNIRKYFVIFNEKNQSVILAKAYFGDFRITTIEHFVPSLYVCGGVSSFFAVDKTHEQILAVKNVKDYRVASFEDIIKVELIEDGRSVTSKSTMRTIGGAVLGDMLAGEAGMVVGGLSGNLTTTKEVSEMRVRILVRDMENPEISILVNDDNINVENDRDTYKARLSEAQKIVNMVSIIIDQIDKRNKDKAIEKLAKQTESAGITDELQKLVDLKNAGVLTDNEFMALKERLLKS